MPFHLRIARPVHDLPRAADMYCRGLGLRLLEQFRDHDGFDGVILGHDAAGYELELTYCRAHPVLPSPTAEDLLIFYIPTVDEWRAACAAMSAAGFTEVTSSNPYWNARARTYADLDGYFIVLHNGASCSGQGQ